MRNLFAEFISPYVSQIHQSDRTITSVHFHSTNFTNHSKINYLSKMSEDVFSLFESISKGNSIDLDKEQCFQLQKRRRIQLQIISILLKNKGNGFYHHTQRYAKKIVVGGYDEYHQIGENPTIKNEDGEAVIHPPQNLQLDRSSLLSYSASSSHSVSVTRSGPLIGAGYNNDGQISGSLEKTVISQFSEFSMNDSSGPPLNPVSAVCTDYGQCFPFSQFAIAEFFKKFQILQEVLKKL